MFFYVQLLGVKIESEAMEGLLFGCALAVKVCFVSLSLVLINSVMRNILFDLLIVLIATFTTNFYFLVLTLFSSWMWYTCTISVSFSLLFLGFTRIFSVLLELVIIILLGIICHALDLLYLLFL